MFLCNTISKSNHFFHLTSNEKELHSRYNFLADNLISVYTVYKIKSTTMLSNSDKTIIIAELFILILTY